MDLLDHTPGIIVHKTQSLPQAMFALASGEVDAMVFQSPLAEHAAQAAGLADRLVRGETPLAEVNRAFAVAPGREDVLRRLNVALDAYRNTPEFQVLYQAWHAEPEMPRLSPAALWTLAGALAVLAGLLLLWRYVSLVRVNRQMGAALAARDRALAALRLTQERMEALLQLTRMGECGTGDVIDFALKEGVRLTGSGLGCLFFLENGADAPSHVHWWGEGGAPVSGTALWSGCLRGRGPIVDNDVDNNADIDAGIDACEGEPSGPEAGARPGDPPRIRRFMAVPLVEDGRVAAVFGVANKQEPYDEADTRQLQLFLAGLWHVLGARRDAAAIRQAKDYAESLIEGANAMVVGLDTNGLVTVFNAAAEAITGYPRDEVLGHPWHAVMLPGHLAADAAALYGSFMGTRTRAERLRRAQAT